MTTARGAPSLTDSRKTEICHSWDGEVVRISYIVIFDNVKISRDACTCYNVVWVDIS